VSISESDQNARNLETPSRGFEVPSRLEELSCGVEPLLIRAVLKSSGSAFEKFYRDENTTLGGE
jgi:urate oxidase